MYSFCEETQWMVWVSYVEECHRVASYRGLTVEIRLPLAERSHLHVPETTEV